MVTELKGAILAAGRGERLRTGGRKTLPKPLVEIANEPLLFRQVRCLVAAGASDVLAVVNSETAFLIDKYRLTLPPKLHLTVRDTANSMESLFALRQTLGSGLFLLATVDAVMTERDMHNFVDRSVCAVRSKVLDTAEAEGALGVVRWRGDNNPLFARVGPDNLIIELGGAESTMVTAGVYLLSGRIFNYVQPARERRLGAMREFLSMLVADGMRLKALEIGEAVDIDEEADLAAACGLLAREAALK